MSQQFVVPIECGEFDLGRGVGDCFEVLGLDFDTPDAGIDGRNVDVESVSGVDGDVGVIGVEACGGFDVDDFGFATLSGSVADVEGFDGVIEG